MLILYNKDEKNFLSNGIGVLDKYAFDDVVVEELNGIFKLEFSYPIFAKYSSKIVADNIVRATTPDSEQPFFISRIIKKDGFLRVTAYHIFYKLIWELIEDINIVGLNGQSALDRILEGTEYTGLSDITKTANIRIVRYNVVEAIINKGKDNTFISRFGGEIKRDRFKVEVKNHVGRYYDQFPSEIRYAKNLVSYEADIDSVNAATRIMPLAFNGLLLPEKYVVKPGADPNNFKTIKVEYPEIKAVQDAQNPKEDEIPLEEAYEKMRQAVLSDFMDGRFDAKASYRIEFQDLATTEEYKNKAVLERLFLGDEVKVIHIDENLDILSRIIAYRWSPLRKEYDEIDLGNHQEGLSNLKPVLEAIAVKVEQYKTDWEKNIDEITLILNSALGGYVYKRAGELLIMDTDDPATALKVWRWNLNGLGYSKVGVNGPYGIAITMNGKINASFIATESLSAISANLGTVIAGRIQDEDNESYWDLDTKEIALNVKSLKILSKDVATSDDLTAIDERFNSAEQKITPDAIIETVESAVTVNGSTVLATKADVALVDDSLTARFSEIGGTNLLLKTSKVEKSILIQSSAALIYPITPLSDLGLKVGDEVVFRVYIRAPYSIGARARINIEYNLQGTSYTAVVGNIITGFSEGYSTVRYKIEPNTVGFSLYLQNEQGSPTNVFYKEDKLEKNTVATAWTPHSEELYTGITRVDKEGINVGRSSSETNTQMSYDGLRVYNGSKERAYFGESGSFMPELQVDKIMGADVINSSEGIAMSVGGGSPFSTITAALDSLNSGNRKTRYILNDSYIVINVYGTLIDHVLLDGWMGGNIQINFRNGAALFGSIRIYNCSSKISISGIESYGKISRYNEAYLITVSNSSNVFITRLNFDYGGGASGRGIHSLSSKIFVENCDFGKLEFAIVAYAGSMIQAVNNVGSATYGYYANNGVFFMTGTTPMNSGISGSWYFSSGTLTPTNSVFQPPAYVPPVTTPTVFTGIFSAANIYTVGHNTETKDAYYGSRAAQNRWDSSMAWKDGVIVFNGDAYNYYQGGTNILVEVRLRRQDSAHGNSGGVAPAPYNFAPSESFNAVGRGIWTEWTTVPSSVFGSGGVTLKFYNGVSGASGYAIWDAAEVKVTVTKNV